MRLGVRFKITTHEIGFLHALNSLDFIFSESTAFVHFVCANSAGLRVLPAESYPLYSSLCSPFTSVSNISFLVRGTR